MTTTAHIGQPATVAVALAHKRTLTVLGERYGAHLAVTPTLADPLDDGETPHYQGYGWTVTHIPSGLAVRRVCCIHDARDTARWLVTSAGIDWTRPARDLGADQVVRDAVHRTRAMFTTCDTKE